MEKGSFFQEFVAGNVGGLAGIVLVYPLDTAKIRMQLNPGYTSIMSVMRSLTQAHGVSALYRGLPSPALGFGLVFAISFSGYGHGCRMIADHKKIELSKLSYSDLSLAGAYTGILQSPCRQVMERVKSVMQVREGSALRAAYSWTGSCAVQLVKEEGWRLGLFRGYWSVLLREVPQFAIYYPSYEYSKSILSQHMPQYPMLVQLLSGGIAGLVQWMPPIYYTDVIKSRMQVALPGQYSGVWDCARKVWAEGGVKAFHRGFGVALLRSFPLHATVFLGYEMTMKMMGNKQQQLLSAGTPTLDVTSRQS